MNKGFSVKKYAFLLSFLCTILICIFSNAGTIEVSAFSGSGSGTAASPFIITTKAQLGEVGNGLAAYYKLGNNIDLGNAEWVPIGTDKTPFTGNFDGNGCSLSNLKITKSTTDYIGLFGYVKAGTIKNVKINNVSITGRNYVGGLAGYTLGSTVIENCSVTGSGIINATMYAGGMVGSAAGSIINCFTTVNLTASNLTSSGSYAGGLIGISSATVSKCYATGNIIANGSSVGGLIGGTPSSNSGNVSQSYATGNVSGKAGVGGLIGVYYSENTSISNCFALGNVTASSTNGVSQAGGLVGDLHGKLVKLINSYSTGKVTVSEKSTFVGGLVGSVWDASVTNCYFDSTTTGFTTPTTQARTTAQLKQQATYSGWDFTNIWNIKEGSSYAYLRQLYNPLDSGVPTAPGNLQVLSTTTSAITLSWNFSTDDFGIAGYKIYRDGKEAGTTVTNQYTDTGLTPGTSYNYIVKAFDNSGNISLPSNQVTAVTEYDVPPQLTIDLPDRVHVKDNLNITTNAVAVGKLPVVWSLQKDGAVVDINTYATANLNTNGGSIAFKSVGNYTLIASITDLTGKIHSFSDTIVVYSNPPTTPVITMNPASNSVTADTVVTIDAASTDPDGDSITYVWDGRIAQQSTYPIGKNTVKVKAVDSTGAESPWAAISFFVLNSTSGGGIVLTGPDSTIVEEGIEGATITEYTFTVPPVDGHSGQDYGRVRGYNKGTGEWEQIELRNTENGITMTGTLPAGKYSKLEFYYYTSHDCMYNKSNITYSVKYNFE